MDFLRQSDEILSVSEFSRRFKMLVKTQVPELWLRGEISNLKTYSSGHTYFKLKDSDAIISAVLFKGYSRGVSFPLREGMKILAYGEISVYEGSGNYQIVIKAAMPDGTGDLAKRFEQLKQKLAEEGLFDKSKKRQIPTLPRNIAVITSPTGAAIRDFCRILTRRAWKGNVFILPARVQGAESAQEIVNQINYAQTSAYNFDLLVVMRGGGSLEDLWSFNEEIVARAVAGSKIPTISAVGHEIDFTLSDFSADLRAETPSAAAEYISSNFIDFSNSITRSFELVRRELMLKMQSVRSLLSKAVDVFRLNSPSVKIANNTIRIDDIQERLNVSIKRITAEKTTKLKNLKTQLNYVGVKPKMIVLQERLNACQKRLENLNVENILARGFSIVRNSSGDVITSATNLTSGEDVQMYFADGKKSATIK
ncbi:MAG: exodeoxyribonuclease VII large subunit [Verrucomicrobiaceae bacterium]|nr:exodeoxyribonuclease VII large subunit [Verrucomicrobiaceae bacterium]